MSPLIAYVYNLDRKADCCPTRACTRRATACSVLTRTAPLVPPVSKCLPHGSKLNPICWLVLCVSRCKQSWCCVCVTLHAKLVLCVCHATSKHGGRSVCSKQQKGGVIDMQPITSKHVCIFICMCSVVYVCVW